MMRRLMTGFVMLASFAMTATGEETKGAKVEYDVHSGHFEKNNSGLTGDASYLAITDKAGFDAIFGVAAVMGKKPNYVPKDALEKKMVAAVIKRGGTVTEYKVKQVTTADGTLYVEYEAMMKGAASTARFASPLILSVDKGKYKTVEFIENGKKVGTATVGK